MSGCQEVSEVIGFRFQRPRRCSTVDGDQGGGVQCLQEDFNFLLLFYGNSSYRQL